MRWIDGKQFGFRECGENVRIYPRAIIVDPQQIRVGSHVIIDDFVFIGAQEELTLGNFVHISSHTSIIGGGKCYLSDFTALSSGVRLLTGSDDFLGGGLTNPTIPAEWRCVSRGAIWLGVHSGLGANAVMLPNTALSTGAVVGAGSVVRKVLTEWSVYVGNPARRVKARPSENIERDEKLLLERMGGLTKRYLDPCYPEILACGREME